MGCEQSLPQQVDPTFINRNNVNSKGEKLQHTGGNTVATARSNRSTFHSFDSPRLQVVIEGVPDARKMAHSASWAPSNKARVTVSEGGTSISSSPGLSSLENGSDEDIIHDLPQLDPNGNLMPAEIVRRTSSSVLTSAVTIGSKAKGGKVVTMQYAYRSQRGYYPDDPLKPNQDKYGIILKFAGEEGDAIFSVFDGHGEKGHECANYAKMKLPQALAKYVRQKRVQRYSETLQKIGNSKKKGAWNPQEWPLLSTADFEEACKKAFRETNKSMSDDKKISDALSGTTAATVCFHGGRMTVCHVGDSRVILGRRAATPKSWSSCPNSSSSAKEEQEEEKHDEDEIMSRQHSMDNRDIVAIPLTNDQTPYRKDERDRLVKAGAEIKTVAQMQGNSVPTDDLEDIADGAKIDLGGADPPRVWAPGKSWPGCAFTRSIGDNMAEMIGVCAEPEIITKDLTVNDEFLVIASDGLFEFLTNQEVINICSASYNPLQACEMLTKASYDKWVEHDTRVDDITLIVCFLSSTFVPSPDEIGETTDALVHHVTTSADDIEPSMTNHQFGDKPEAHHAPRLTEVYSHNFTATGSKTPDAATMAPMIDVSQMEMEMEDD